MKARGLLKTARVEDFDEIFSRNCGFVWRVLGRLGVRAGDLPDACQEAFLVVHRRLGDFDPSRAALQSWLYGICLRVASDYRRRHPSRQEAPEELLAEVGSGNDPSAELEQAGAWAHLARVLERIGPDQSDVFVLYELEGLAMSEIASLLGCPVQTAYARLHAARRHVLAAFNPASSR